MIDSIFRSYDIRGQYPNMINEATAYKIGLGYGSILQERYSQSSCVVSRDNRLSSPGLHDALIKGLLETGLNVIDYGITTTPMNYYMRHINNLFGIMITASHNPYNENGFKFSFDHFANARGKMISDFKDYINYGEFIKGSGILTIKDGKDAYIKYIKNNINLGNKHLKVVYDAANGSITTILNDILKEFNIEYEIINSVSDGLFPSHQPDPSVEENLKDIKTAVLDKHADLGFSFDGDGDRLGIVDHLGNMVSIEDYGIILAKNIIKENNNAKFLYDAKCSHIFKDEIERLGAKSEMCRTGSSYTEERIIKDGFAFGIQYVGHIGINDRTRSTESAIYASLRLLEILTNEQENLHNIVSLLPAYENIPEMRILSTEEKKINVIKNIKKYCDKYKYDYIEIDGLKIVFKTGWIYIRASNTGPTINLRAEATNKEDLHKLVQTFSSLIDIFNK